MEVVEVKSLLENKLSDCSVEVEGDGSHFDLVIVGDLFEGLSAVKKQQLVYGAINDKIADGSIHAVNMKIYTCAEWQAKGE